MTGKLFQTIQENVLLTYKPLMKQQLFHQAGKRYIERLLMSGNQYGKTYCGAAEVAIHAQGMYENLDFEWLGRRWLRPVRILVIGHDFEQMRDSCQKHLFGYQGNWGTGLIQKSSIVGEPKMNRDKPGCISHCFVRSLYGGESLIRMASESQGPEAIEGGQWDIILFDEMPKKAKMVSQAKARTTWTGGMIMITATPEDGYTEIVASYLDDDLNDNMKYRFHITASAEENPYLPKEHVKKLWASYTPEERAMRVEGIPLFGSGLIYPYSKESYLVKPFHIPVEWPRLCAVDPGYKNSWTALLFGAMDPYSGKTNADCTSYFYYLQRRKGVSCEPVHLYPIYHDQCMLWTGNPNTKIPMTYPADANHPGRTGLVIAQEYRKAGFMMTTHAARVKLINGKYSHGVDDGITYCQGRFVSGKVKIFDTPIMDPLVKELLRYSEDDEGKIIQKNRFDCLDAMRYYLTSIQNVGYGGNKNIKRSVKVTPTCLATSYH